MIYLGLISDRVPIVPPFAPSHHICRYSHFNYNGLADQISARAAGVVSMGEIFDMVHLRDTLRSPVLEWSDVKDLTGPTSDSDTLGCWSARSRADEDPSGAENLLAYLKLDVAYTRVPDSMFRSSREGDVFTNTWPLVSLVFPGGPERQTSVWKKTSSGIEVRPDRQMACFDSLYYMGTGVEEYEWQQAWGPAWRQVGRNLKFSSKMVELAETYARSAIGVAENATLTPVSNFFGHNYAQQFIPCPSSSQCTYDMVISRAPALGIMQPPSRSVWLPCQPSFDEYSRSRTIY